MILVIFLTVLCLASASLGATSAPFKRGRCAMVSIRQKRPENRQSKLYMRQLIITYARHAVPGCCRGNVTDLECLSYDNEWLIDDVCLSVGVEAVRNMICVPSKILR